MSLGIARKQIRIFETQVLFPKFFALEVYCVAAKSPTLASNHKFGGVPAGTTQLRTLGPVQYRT